MPEQVDNPENLQPVAKTGDDPLTEAFGIWKDWWPAGVFSVDIARRLRNEQWNRDRTEKP